MFVVLWFLCHYTRLVALLREKRNNLLCIRRRKITTESILKMCMHWHLCEQFVHSLFISTHEREKRTMCTLNCFCKRKIRLRKLMHAINFNLHENLHFSFFSPFLSCKIESFSPLPRKSVMMVNSTCFRTIRFFLVSQPAYVTFGRRNVCIWKWIYACSIFIVLTSIWH